MRPTITALGAALFANPTKWMLTSGRCKCPNKEFGKIERVEKRCDGRSVRQVVQEGPVAFCRTRVVYGRVIAVKKFRAANPALRQAVPDRFVFGVAREFGHNLAFGGKS
jgi:hypothetical protein